MLRVYSILYLQQVWERPASSVVVQQQQILNDAAENQDIVIDNHSNDNEIIAAMATHDEEIEEEESCYGTVNIVSSTSSSQHHSTTTRSNSSDEPSSILVQQQEQEHNNKENKLNVSFDQVSCCSNSTLNSIINGNAANTLLSLPVMPSSRSETSFTTQHPHEEQTFPITKEEEEKKILVLNNTNIEREFYEDDISSDTEGEEEEIKELPTPPSTPTSSKFSPKRILHRAKSSIQDDSVRKIGRRTSLFLEKCNQLHQQQQQQQSVSPLPPINTLPHQNQNTKNSNIKEDFSKGLRRQSSKITVKGKTLTKKLKRVLSFHQTTTTTLA